MASTGLQSELNKTSPFASAQQEAHLNIARTHAAVAAPVHALFKRFGLSEPQYNALRILRGAAPAGKRCSEIGADMVVRVPDVTRLVDRLIDAGLADRQRSDQDRRVVWVHITDDGLELLARIDEPLLALHAAQFPALSDRELGQLNRLLTKARTTPKPDTE